MPANLTSFRFTVIAIFIIAIQCNLFGQKVFKEKLYYFSNADSTKVGVKNEQGKVIIKPTGTFFIPYDFVNPIPDEIIEFIGTEQRELYVQDSPLIPGGEVYDRSGKLLYIPQWFDNGIDYFAEGYRRYVEGNKMGFVNASGQKIIPAQWDFALPFSYGYTTVYTGGWKKEYEKGGEHWFIVPASQKAESYLINRAGEMVLPYKKQKNSRDYFFNGEYYPDPFVYSLFEQKMVDYLNKMDILNDINIATCDNCIPKSDWKLNFEITEYPSDFFPYYTIQGYSDQKNDDDTVFYASKDGQSFFRKTYEGKVISLNIWISLKLKYLKEYFQTHPDKINKFHID